MLSDASLVPLSWSAHGGLMWQRFTSYHFAAEVHWVPLAEQELAQAALAFPVAFRWEEGCWTVGALLGLTPGQNAWVDDEGRWCHRYVPAALRSPPFGVHREDPGILCVDEHSEWLVQHYEGEPLFDDQRAPASFVQKTHEFLKAWADGSRKLGHMARVLGDHDVLTAWESPALTGLPGLYHVDEAAWNALSDDAAIRVRRQGALPLIYAHLLAKANLGSLHARAQQPRKSSSAVSAPPRENRHQAVLDSWRDALAEEPAPDEWTFPSR